MLHCTRCERAIDEGPDLSAVLCRWCGTRLEVEAFPALSRTAVKGDRGKLLRDEGEAACFKHSTKQAIADCSRCGRFLCSVCEVEMGSEVLCFECFAEGARRGGGGELESRAILWDSIALTLAILPLLLWPFTILTAPLALFLSIRYWKRPGGIVPRTKARFVFAALLALLQISGWVVLGLALLSEEISI